MSHLRAHNSLDKKGCSCVLCYQSFATLRGLAAHLVVHRGEKAYCCLLCGEPYFTSCSLAIHLRVHIQIESYKCPICPKYFYSSKLFARHLKRKKILLYIVFRIVFELEKPEGSCESSYQGRQILQLSSMYGIIYPVHTSRSSFKSSLLGCKLLTSYR